MKYVIVSKLPKNCYCVENYPYPFKITRSKLYVYDPGVDCYGDACWFRRSHTLNCDLAFYLMAYAR